MQGVENISALMDGELSDDEAARVIAHLKQDAARRGAWGAYHVIGEAMRGEHRGAIPVLSPAFSHQLSERLALEPTVLAPRMRSPKATLQTYALSAAASVAAVAAVGWMAFNMLGPDTAPGTLAMAPAAKQPVVAPAPVVAMQPPPAPSLAPGGVEAVATAPEHVHEYLLAHQGISPSTAIQGVTPYIRTVSSVSDARAVR